MSSNKKLIKINRRNQIRQTNARSEMKTAIRKAESAIAAKKENAKDLVSLAIKKIDKSISNKIIHKNEGARRKSRLVKKFNLIKTSKK